MVSTKVGQAHLALVSPLPRVEYFYLQVLRTEYQAAATVVLATPDRPSAGCRTSLPPRYAYLSAHGCIEVMRGAAQSVAFTPFRTRASLVYVSDPAALAYSGYCGQQFGSTAEPLDGSWYACWMDWL